MQEDTTFFESKVIYSCIFNIREIKIRIGIEFFQSVIERERNKFEVN